jgi:hypothetical protein
MLVLVKLSPDVPLFHPRAAVATQGVLARSSISFRAVIVAL